MTDVCLSTAPPFEVYTVGWAYNKYVSVYSTYQLELFCIIAVLIQVTSEPANASLLITTTK